MDVSTLEFSAMWMPPAQRDPVTPVCIDQPPKSLLAPPPCERDELDQARSLVTAVARAAVEALTDYRPVSQLTRWLAPAAVGGLTMAKRHGTWKGARIRRVWAKHNGTSTIDGVAQVTSENHHLAITIGLERLDGHWICTHLAVLLPGSHLAGRY